VHNFSVNDRVPIRGAVSLGELREVPGAIHPARVLPLLGGFAHHASFRGRGGIFAERIVAGFRAPSFERRELLFRVRRRSFDDGSILFVFKVEDTMFKILDREREKKG
jgi:hypothetical protein